MNDDLISRAAAIDILDAYQVMVENGEENPYAWARLRMSELPPAQPQIIRCKDCKYACIDPERESDEIYCSENDFWKDDDFYCGYAERRTDG